MKFKVLNSNNTILNYIMSSLYSNNLLIIFSLGLFCSLYYCSNRKKDYQYVVLENAEPIKGEIVDSKV